MESSDAQKPETSSSSRPSGVHGDSAQSHSEDFNVATKTIGTDDVVARKCKQAQPSGDIGERGKKEHAENPIHLIVDGLSNVPRPTTTDEFQDEAEVETAISHCKGL